MARLSTCKTCGLKLTKDEKYTYSNKTYCEKCYNSKIKDRQDYDNLLNVILAYFNIEVPNGLILKQIKDYKENYNYTYAGINYCLWYITQIKNINLDIKYGIAMVKYEYDKAKEYFEQQQRIQDSIVKPIENEVIRKVKIKTNSKKRDRFLINLDELGGE